MICGKKKHLGGKIRSLKPEMVLQILLPDQQFLLRDVGVEFPLLAHSRGRECSNGSFNRENSLLARESCGLLGPASRWSRWLVGGGCGQFFQKLVFLPGFTFQPVHKRLGLAARSNSGRNNFLGFFICGNARFQKCGHFLE